MSNWTPPPGVIFTKTMHHDSYPAINPLTASNLRGKSVFITGASKGIGRATALSYAKAGCSHIAVGARSSLSTLESDIIEAAKLGNHPAPQIVSLTIDVESGPSITEAVEKLQSAFNGKLDILINNAGYLEEWKPIIETDEDDYWKSWQVSYRGVYLVTKAVLPMLLATQGGLKTIVNISSIGALLTTPGASSYQTVKFALLKFTEFVMAEYGSKGILCYACHPGGVMTDLASKMPTAIHASRVIPLLSFHVENVTDGKVRLG